MLLAKVGWDWILVQNQLNFFQNALKDCKTVIWNGPMGVFEFEKFANGTNAIANTLAELSAQGCCTIIGGGDSVAAVEKAGLAKKNVSYLDWRWCKPRTFGRESSSWSFCSR